MDELNPSKPSRQNWMMISASDGPNIRRQTNKYLLQKLKLLFVEHDLGMHTAQICSHQKIQYMVTGNCTILISAFLFQNISIFFKECHFSKGKTKTDLIRIDLFGTVTTKLNTKLVKGGQQE